MWGNQRRQEGLPKHVFNRRAGSTIHNDLRGPPCLLVSGVPGGTRQRDRSRCSSVACGTALPHTRRAFVPAGSQEPVDDDGAHVVVVGPQRPPLPPASCYIRTASLGLWLACVEEEARGGAWLHAWLHGAAAAAAAMPSGGGPTPGRPINGSTGMYMPHDDHGAGLPCPASRQEASPGTHKQPSVHPLLPLAPLHWPRRHCPGKHAGVHACWLVWQP